MTSALFPGQPGTTPCAHVEFVYRWKEPIYEGSRDLMIEEVVMTSKIRRDQSYTSALSSTSPDQPHGRLARLTKPGWRSCLRSRSPKTSTGPPVPPTQTPGPPPATASPGGKNWVRHDPLLLSAFGASALLIIYQLIVILLKPPWLGPVTDWLRALLAWPEMLPLVLVGLWLIRTRRPGRLPWWMVSAALLCYALAQNLWMVFDQYLEPGRVPVPSWADLFYLLQYPFLCLALLVLMPGAARQSEPKIIRAKIILDSLLLTAAGTALSWYFLLAPIYMRSSQPGLGKAVNLSYPVGDLVLLIGLAIVIARWRRQVTDYLSLCFLVAAIILLVVADSWFAYLNLNGEFQTGEPPDLFWLASYLAFALAGLVKFRAIQCGTTHETSTNKEAVLPLSQLTSGLSGGFQFFLPFLIAFLASIAIVGKAIMTQVNSLSLIVPFMVSLGLLVLVMARQGITMLENEWLRQEWEIAYANDLALREAAQQMDAFLGIASHELKTPLTTIMLGLQLIQRHLHNLAHSTDPGRDSARVETCQTILEDTFRQGRRLGRLVEDLLDTSRIREGQLQLHQQPAELIALVRAAVEEQRRIAPERSILLHELAQPPVAIFADPDRIGQVITNYLTNALKYSSPESPVRVGVQTVSQQGRVWVSDQGPGLSPEAQGHIWERFYRIPEIEAQSGSEVGLGLGLHICKTIIELHQGQVGVESVPGEGATFWFTIPLSTEARQNTL